MNPTHSDMFEEFARWNEQIKALPEPLAYIVLDHALPYLGHVDARDAKGRRYVRVSPALLDEVRHVKQSGITSLMDDSLTRGLLGIPVYRREDMPEGWPDA